MAGITTTEILYGCYRCLHNKNGKCSINNFYPVLLVLRNFARCPDFKKGSCKTCARYDVFNGCEHGASFKGLEKCISEKIYTPRKDLNFSVFEQLKTKK